MTATRDCSSHCESESIGAAVRRILARPWTALVVHWNWKAALLSAGFRGLLFCVALVPRGAGDLRGAWIEVAFRIAVGGCWGSIMQELRRARPAWLAGLLMTVALPGSAHALEYGLFKLGAATHIKSAMMVSVSFSMASLAVNYALMRRGLMVTGEGSSSLRSDFRRLPAALKDCVVSAARSLRRVFRGAA